MRDRILKVIFVLTILFVLYLFFAPYIIIELWNIQSGKSTMLELTFNDFKYNIDGSINKDKYNRILNEYIKNRFGDLVFEKLSIVKNDGNRYMVKFEDILDGTFFIQYHKAKGACSDNFYEVLLADNKFQHLYSEWVKKQIGIDDGNVELEFDRAIINSRLIGDDIYIDFSKITSLDNLEDHICMNTKNYYLKSIDVKMVDVNIKEKWLDRAKNVKEEYIKIISNIIPSLIFNDKIIVKLYYYDVDLVFDKYNKTKTDKNDKLFYYVQFDLKNNKIKYLSDYYDSTWGTVLSNWLTEIEYD